MEETTLTERGLSMRNTPEDAARLERKFKSCQKVLTALGDPTRQHLICIMLQQKCSGERVIELARKTNLSRPAISQHMRILKEAGIVKSRKEKTCIYYYLDPEMEELDNLLSLFGDIREFMKNVPDRSGEN